MYKMPKSTNADRNRKDSKVSFFITNLETGENLERESLTLRQAVDVLSKLNPEFGVGWNWMDDGSNGDEPEIEVCDPSLHLPAYYQGIGGENAVLDFLNTYGKLA